MNGKLFLQLSLWTLKVISQRLGGTSEPDLPKLAMEYLQYITPAHVWCLCLKVVYFMSVSQTADG